jgi:F-type H+-transporting ATPase subunit delta
VVEIIQLGQRVSQSLELAPKSCGHLRKRDRSWHSLLRQFPTSAGRYAGSLFELALAEKSVSQVEYDLLAFEGLIDESADLRRLIESPECVFSADDQYRAIAAIADKAGLHGLVGNFLKVVAKNRRLFAVPGIIKAFRAIAADHRGEIVADVTAAQALTRDQEAELKAALTQVAGKTVTVKVAIDPSLLGGLRRQDGLAPDRYVAQDQTQFAQART